jgi:phage shock protein A
MQYENTHSPDRQQVIEWAIRNAKAGVRFCERTLSEARESMDRAEKRLRENKDELESYLNCQSAIKKWQSETGLKEG